MTLPFTKCLNSSTTYTNTLTVMRYYSTNVIFNPLDVFLEQNQKKMLVIVALNEVFKSF